MHLCNVQGERGHAFYIVESGQLSAFKDNQPLPVMSYGPGGMAVLLQLADINRHLHEALPCALVKQQMKDSLEI